MEVNPVNHLFELKYWKNGVAHLMPVANTSGNDHIGPLFVSGNDVYISGSTPNSGSPLNSFATIWKNGVATQLTDGTDPAGLIGVAVSGNDVYAAGWNIPQGSTYGNIKTWKNGVATDITDGTQNASASAMCVSATDIYLCGQEWKSSVTPNWQAVVWKNGTPTYLTDGTYQSFAYSVFVNTY